MLSFSLQINSLHCVSAITCKVPVKQQMVLTILGRSHCLVVK